jgi:hypothetical protein
MSWHFLQERSTMNPPWITLWNQVRGSIGNDPRVTTTRLDQSRQPYLIRITVRDNAKAVGLASLVKRRHNFGNITVVVRIEDRQGNHVNRVVPKSPRELAGLVRSAFTRNGWYRKVLVKEFFGRLRVYAVFAKKVVQFYNDDLSDLYGNYNGVAGAVFADVLGARFGGFELICSTSKR